MLQQPTHSKKEVSPKILFHSDFANPPCLSMAPMSFINKSKGIALDTTQADVPISKSRWIFNPCHDSVKRRRQKFLKKIKTFFPQKNQDANFCHIWIQHEKCIQMSTNKPTFGAVIREIAPRIFIKNCHF